LGARAQRHRRARQAFFLERCLQLESGKDRKATHQADLAALATLESRGLTKKERRRIGALVDFVDRHKAPLPEDDLAATTEEHAARVLELQAWVLDWRNVAKIVIKRRDLLLKLGIGRRKSRNPIAAPPQPVTPVVTTGAEAPS
jgi:hypothetical protein